MAWYLAPSLGVLRDEINARQSSCRCSLLRAPSTLVSHSASVANPPTIEARRALCVPGVIRMALWAMGRLGRTAYRSGARRILGYRDVLDVADAPTVRAGRPALAGGDVVARVVANHAL